MGNVLKYGIAFVLGAGAGVLGTKVYFEEKYKRIADEEIEGVKDAYFAEIDKRIEKVVDEAVEEAIDETEDESYYPPYVDRSSLDISRNTAAELQAQKAEYFNRLAESEHPTDDTSDDPYEISEEIFSETELDYTKETLQYFVDDDSLYDPAEDELVTYKTIGDEGLNRLRTSDDTYSMFFRDDKHAVDYEIVKVSGGYYQE